MLDDTSRLTLKLVASLLGYPDRERRQKWMQFETVKSELTDDARTVLEGMCQAEMAVLQDAYVQAFDLSAKTALYLTVHEYGDSRKRGPALLDLRRMLEEAGFEEPEGELPDYLPLLFEFSAVCPKIDESLLARLGSVSAKVRDGLPADHPYRTTLQLGVATIGSGEPESLHGRENPDLADLPFPVTYE